MTDRSKFEQMLEHLINEDQDKAKELFHQLVVEKSREIYETILAEDFADLAEEDDEEDEEKVEEAKDKDDEDEEKVEEDFSFVEGEDEGDDIGGDATDDFIDDVDAEGGEDMGDDEEGGEDLEDRVVDLEDALDDLRAEFEALMSDEAGEEEHSDMDMGGDMDDEEMKDSFDPNYVREYVEKVAPAKMGDNGANAKSVVAGKNDMGGTAGNIVRNDTANDGEVGAGRKIKGSSLINQTPKEDNAGNINVPGGKAGSAFTKKEPGHGAEKKGAGENADKSAGSLLNGVKSRAK